MENILQTASVVRVQSEFFSLVWNWSNEIDSFLLEHISHLWWSNTIIEYAARHW